MGHDVDNHRFGFHLSFLKGSHWIIYLGVILEDLVKVVLGLKNRLDGDTVL